MSRDLRFNTAQRVTVGPFFLQSDGLTPVTILTVTSEKLTMTVDEAGVPTLVLDTNPTASGGSNDMVHISGDDSGMFDLELAAADVNHLGRAKLALTNAAAHCPVFENFNIITQNEYDAKYGAVVRPANATLLAGQTINAAGAVTFPAAVGDGTAASQTTISNKIGAVTGSGNNTLLGILKALASKTLPLPSDIGGAFDNTTDSLEAQIDAFNAALATEPTVVDITTGVWAAANRTLTALAEAVFAADTAKYQAEVRLIDDNTGGTDRWTCIWFKNGQPVLSGVTSATIQVIKEIDGADLVGAIGMTQIGSTATYRYRETANRVVNGSSYIAKVTATIDGGSRTWETAIGRDS